MTCITSRHRHIFVPFRLLTGTLFRDTSLSTIPQNSTGTMIDHDLCATWHLTAKQLFEQHQKPSGQMWPSIQDNNCSSIILHCCLVLMRRSANETSACRYLSDTCDASPGISVARTAHTQADQDLRAAVAKPEWWWSGCISASAHMIKRMNMKWPKEVKCWHWQPCTSIWLMTCSKWLY